MSTTLDMPAPLTDSLTAASVDKSMLAVSRRQRIQDFFFHKITLLFSLLVLAALMGILISLLINALPTFQKFGFEFIWRVEWDIANEEFGAAIAIVGTLISAAIALLIARSEEHTSELQSH